MEEIALYQTPQSTPERPRAPMAGGEHSAESVDIGNTKDQAVQTDQLSHAKQRHSPWVYTLYIVTAWSVLFTIVGLAGMAGLHEGVEHLTQPCKAVDMTFNIDLKQDTVKSLVLCRPGEGNYGYYYLAFILQFLACCGIVLAIKYKQLRLYRQTISIVLIMSSAMLMTCANTCTIIAQQGESALDDESTACAVGSSMVLAGNIVLFVFLCVGEASVVYRALYAASWPNPFRKCSWPRPTVIMVSRPIHTDPAAAGRSQTAEC